MRRLIFVGVLSLLSSLGTQACGARVKQGGVKELKCQGEAAAGQEARESRLRHEQGELFAFATRILGDPSRCDLTWKKSDDGLQSSLVYTFSDGSTLSFEALPPETSITRLLTVRGFPDEAAARKVLEQQVKQAGFSPAWDKPPQIRSQADGKVVQIFWDSTGGVNAGADHIYRGDKLVGIAIHMAL